MYNKLHNLNRASDLSDLGPVFCSGVGAAGLEPATSAV